MQALKKIDLNQPVNVPNAIGFGALAVSFLTLLVFSGHGASNVDAAAFACSIAFFGFVKTREIAIASAAKPSRKSSL